MMISKIILFSLLAISFQLQAAETEDDILNILENKSTTEQTVDQALKKVDVKITQLKKALKPSGAEQNIFFQFLQEKNYEKALFQFALAYHGTSFHLTPNGQALEGYIKFKNNLKVVGLEQVIAIASPHQINPALSDLWSEAINSTDSVWGLVQGSWHPHLTKIFGEDAEVSFLLKQNYTQTPIDELTALVKKTTANSKQRAILQWQLVLNLALRDEPQKAAKVLASLNQIKNNPIDQNLIDITTARLLYQSGYLDAAIKYYQKLSKNSDHWFQAQEEMAWAYMRKGEPQNAIAITKSLTYSHFKGFVGLEAFLLDGFSRLKVCDYSGVIGTVSKIKPQFSEHLKALEKLAADGNQPQSEKLAKALLEKGNVTIDQLGAAAHQLPMIASKDEMLKILIQTQKALESEAQHAEALYSKSLHFGNLQGRFELMKNKIKTRADLAKSAFFRRLQELSQAELADAKQVLQRLHIVEVEMIQQVDASGKLAKNLPKDDLKVGKPANKNLNKHAVSYFNDDELWFDELSNFKVDIKNGCTQKTVQ